MEFRLLGDIEALADGGLVDLGHLRQRSVLVALLLEANRIVSVDQLVDRVWAQRQPHRAKDTLYGYLHRLRKALADSEDVTIVRQPGGYSIAVDETQIDLYRFREMLRQARAAGEDSVAVALFEQALSLWRGDAFAGVDTPWVNGVRDTLQKERFAAQLDHIDLRLRQGEHTELVTELVTLAGEHRWDERLAGQLMLALYRSGRQADALAHCERTRTALAEELGLDPGPALQRLHQQILTADPAMTAPAGASVRVPAPRQLPAAPRLFTGRKDELAQLTKTVDASGNQGGVMVISAIGGSGGIGKTWLALCWAHQNSARFPDGQLYVNLNGFDPTGEPLSPAVAVRGFLEALGIGSAAIPLDPQARVGLYRSLVADRRMLIVLDNARDTAQVAPLLPGDGGCVVLVTSRNRMEGLVTAHGAVPLALDALTEDEARRLLVRHVGQERVAAEPEATSELLKRCSGLPLAIGIVAARVVTTPTLSLAALAEELRDPSARLDTMSTGELATNLREVFFGSYHALTRDAARLLRLLGLAQLPEVGIGAAASLAGVPVSGVRGLLRELEVAHLVQQHMSGRYRMHDLVRLYAHERAQHEEPDPTGALRRLADFYLHTAHAGDRLLHPNRPQSTLDPPVAGCAPEPLADAAAARSWFDSEHACLTIVERQAAQHGWDTVVWQLAWSATGFRLRRGHFHDNITAWQAAITAADRAGSPAMQATARLNLGQTLTHLGQLEQARVHLTPGLAFAEAAGDARVAARIHSTLAQTWALQDNNHKAVAHATNALELSRTLDNPRETASALGNLGWFQAQLGHYGDARTSCEAALTLNRELSQPDNEAENLDSLGHIAHHSGEFRDALSYYSQALDLTRQTGNAYTEAHVLDHLGETRVALHQPAEARRAWQTAADLFRAQHRLAEADRVQRRLLELPLINLRG